MGSPWAFVGSFTAASENLKTLRAALPAQKSDAEDIRDSNILRDLVGFMDEAAGQFDPLKKSAVAVLGSSDADEDLERVWRVFNAERLADGSTLVGNREG